MPLGEDYTWGGYENFDKTIEAIFSEPFGQGYPKSDADRKLKDTKKLKELKLDTYKLDEIVGKNMNLDN